MELKFIWIKEHFIIENLGVNFNHSGKHSFEFDGQSIKLLPNKKGNLDFGSNISGITAIAGKNGSGKTTLCQAILSTAATYNEGSLGYNYPSDGIVCYDDHIFYQENIVIENIEELTKEGYKVISFSDTPFEEMNREKYGNFLKDGFIYYSSQFNPRNFIDEMNLVNISTENLLSEDYRYSPRYSMSLLNNKDNLNENRNKVRFGDIEIYNENEAYRLVNFYVNNSNLIPFSALKSFVIKPTFLANNRWLDITQIDGYDYFGTFERIEENILRDLYDLNYPISYETEIELEDSRIKLALHQLYKYNIMRAMSVTKHTLPNKQYAIEFIYEDRDAIGIWDNGAKINRLCSLHKTILSRGILSSNNTIKIKPKTIEHLSSKINDDWRYHVIENLYVNNTEENASLLREFIFMEDEVLSDDYRHYKRITGYSYTGSLSGGEYSYLSFFSRLYDAFYRFDNAYEDRENLILFIDEPETGYHPEWKRHFLYWMLSFLKTQDKYKYQIILTTHSPYLLSDLPPENVILLQRGASGHTEIASSGTYSTFGANIHELLADTFFLTNGTIGEFAKQNIQYAIDQLNIWRGILLETNNRGLVKEMAESKEKVFQIISIIGDSVIRHKLLDMYWELFGDSDTIQWEIQQLQMRIDDLKKRQ